MGGQDDFVWGVFVQLLVNQAMHAVPEFHHASNASFGSLAQLGLHHACVFPVIDIAVYQGKGIVFYIGVCGDAFVQGQAITNVRLLGQGILPLNAADGVLQKVCQILVRQGNTGCFLAVQSAYHLHFAQHHVGVI